MPELDPFAPGNGRPLEYIEWATPHDHVVALNFVAQHARDADELRELAEMIGYGTDEMRERYQLGLAQRRAFRTTRGETL